MIKLFDLNDIPQGEGLVEVIKNLYILGIKDVVGQGLAEMGYKLNEFDFCYRHTHKNFTVMYEPQDKDFYRFGNIKFTR